MLSFLIVRKSWPFEHVHNCALYPPKESNISIYAFMPLIPELCSLSHRLFTARFFPSSWLKCSNGRRLHTTENEKYSLRSGAVSYEFIVFGRLDGKIYVHRIGDGFNLVRTIDQQKFHHFQGQYTTIIGISFLNADIIMVKTRYGGIFSFRSIPGIESPIAK